MKSHNPGWWMHYPQRHGCPYREPQSSPEPNQQAVFEVGTVVRLRGKPDVARRVVAVHWHSWWHDYVYYVETSTGIGSGAYWHASQLVPETCLHPPTYSS